MTIIIVIKKSAFEDMEFPEMIIRVSNDKLPFRFIPEIRHLDESKEVKFALKDDACVFLAGKLDPKKDSFMRWLP